LRDVFAPDAEDAEKVETSTPREQPMPAMDRPFPTVNRCTAVLVGLLLSGLACLAQAPAPGGRLMISDVIIQGNRLVPTEQIKAQLQTRPGTEFVKSVVEEDVRNLYATRQYGNISPYTQDDGPGRVKVYFFIRDYPSVVEEVTYLGAKHLSPDDLNQITGIRKGSPLNPHANKVACHNIVRRLNEDGRPFAHCDLVSGGDPGDTKVVFNITEGPKVKVRGVHFEGNTFVNGAVLKTHINSSDGPLGLGVFGSTYNPAMIDADVNDLERYYRSFGFHDVHVSRDLQRTPDGKDVIVTFHIQEGLRYHVQDVPKVDGVHFMPHEALEAMSKVKAGDYYSENVIEGDLKRIKDYIGYMGREVRTQAVPVFSKEVPGLVQVQYEVEERPPARVGQIFIIGNERTRQNVILRQVPLYPGQLLTYPDVAQAERNLARLNIFETKPEEGIRPTVTVLDNPANPDSEFKDIQINVQEASTGSLLFGLGVNSDTGLTGSIVLNERNFDITRPPTSLEDILNGTAWRGGGQEFRAEAVPGTQLQRYTVSLREPFLFDSPYSLTVSGYYYDRQYNEYTESRLGSRITIGRKLNDYWSANVGVRVENVGVNSIPLGAPPDYQDVEGNNFLLGFRGGVTRDTRDSFLRPTEGSLIDLSYEEVTGDHTFPLINLDATKYWTVYQRADGSGRHVLALHSQIGWAGDNTPVYERYFAGGFRTLRGFQFRGVSPDINGFKVGGDFLALNSLEYQIPIKANDNIYFVTFLDSGTVATRINQVDDYRVSAGFGLRFVVPMLGPVPIALDFGFPIVKGPADDTQVFNFWMGFYR
jgi:outer membrane protein assembly complex protein YaeT